MRTRAGAGLGAGVGDWRLELSSRRTQRRRLCPNVGRSASNHQWAGDGGGTSCHLNPPATIGRWLLRLVNRGSRSASVRVWIAVDDRAFAWNEVLLYVGADSARTSCPARRARGRTEAPSRASAGLRQSMAGYLSPESTP